MESTEGLREEKGREGGRVSLKGRREGGEGGKGGDGEREGRGTKGRETGEGTNENVVQPDSKIEDLLVEGFESVGFG